MHAGELELALEFFQLAEEQGFAVRIEILLYFSNHAAITLLA